MGESWCKVASNLDSHPKIRRAGRAGREVFLFALRRNAEPHHQTPGAIASDAFEPWYIADVLMMDEAEATQALEACERAKLLRRKGEYLTIVGWDDGEWGREKSTERVREWRALQKEKKQNETAKPSGETLRNVPATNGNVAKRSATFLKSRETDETARSEEIRSEEIRSDLRVPASGSTNGAGEARGAVGDVFGVDGADSDGGPSEELGGTEKGSPPRSHASTARNERPPPDPPVPALTTASVLMDYLLRNHPNSKLARCSENERENTLLRWANDVRLIHELDRREYGAIQAMIHWCQRDSFWSTVILSASNLRDKFDKMDAQRKRPRGANGKADVTPEEVNARRAREQRTEADLRRSENERAARAAADRGEVQAMIASVAKRGIGAAGSAEPTEPLDDEPESREDEPDVG